MGVDHAGHQCAPAAIDHLHIGNGIRDRDQRLDAIAFDKHVPPLQERTALSIENIDVLQPYGPCGRLRESGAHRTKRRGCKAGRDALQDGTARQAFVYAREKLPGLLAMTGACTTMDKVAILVSETKRQDIPSHLPGMWPVKCLPTS
ncbi:MULTISPECIES: hypothetical protein [unclassified Shinella]|uniref:hypothetical protein n=1 Tax=unclassified Shinella TaxID=2643062 RepID=UPI00234EBAA1|nr:MULTISPECIES: hypothetical protein [unclassified Shinella]MCO5141159.1 hypothetical protein [Shinella sp.]